jgi:hypothetical protein
MLAAAARDAAVNCCHCCHSCCCREPTSQSTWAPADTFGPSKLLRHTVARYSSTVTADQHISKGYPGAQGQVQAKQLQAEYAKVAMYVCREQSRSDVSNQAGFGRTQLFTAWWVRSAEHGSPQAWRSCELQCSFSSTPTQSPVAHEHTPTVPRATCPDDSGTSHWLAAARNLKQTSKYSCLLSMLARPGYCYLCTFTRRSCFCCCLT